MLIVLGLVFVKSIWGLSKLNMAPLRPEWSPPINEKISPGRERTNTRPLEGPYQISTEGPLVREIPWLEGGGGLGSSSPLRRFCVCTWWQVPGLDAVLVAVSGGGMIAGIATALRELRPQCRGNKSGQQRVPAGERVQCPWTSNPFARLIALVPRR